MPGILRNLRIQAISPLPIRLITLLHEPISKQTPRRRITRTGQRLLERRPRSGRAERSERPRKQQGRLRLLPRLRASIKQPAQSTLSSNKLPNSKLRLRHT